MALDHGAIPAIRKEDLTALADSVDAESVAELPAVETGAGEPPAAETPAVEPPPEPPVPAPAPAVALVQPSAAAGNRERNQLDPGQALQQARYLTPESEIPVQTLEPGRIETLLADRMAQAAAPIVLKFARVSEPQEALATGTGSLIRPSLAKLASPPACGLVKYSVEALRQMRAVAPPAVLFVPAAEPRTTLAGPVLPRELNSLAEAGLKTVLTSPRTPYQRRSAARLLLLGLLTVVLIAGAALYILPPLLLSGKATTTQAEAQQNDRVLAPVGTYPLSKTIEVTGFRFAVDLNGKSEIHYLVVNHSGAQFGAVTVYVTLHDREKPNQAPVARFSFRAPDMGPFASREMTSSIEKMSRPVALPEWQDLRAEVEIAE